MSLDKEAAGIAAEPVADFGPEFGHAEFLGLPEIVPAAVAHIETGRPVARENILAGDVGHSRNPRRKRSRQAPFSARIRGDAVAYYGR